jgi:hypothetical protein
MFKGAMATLMKNVGSYNNDPVARWTWIAILRLIALQFRCDLSRTNYSGTTVISFAFSSLEGQTNSAGAIYF